MKKNLDIGTPLLYCLRKGAVVGGAIGAIGGVPLGLFIAPALIGLNMGAGSNYLLTATWVFFSVATSGVFCGACLGLGFWLLWVIWKLFS
jgi:hypothetical protein